MRKLFLIVAIGLAAFALACGRSENSNRPNTNATANANRAEGVARSDDWIKLKTRLALVAHSPTNGYETDVEVRGGAVTLTGKVDTDEAKAEAEQVARKIEGVRGVNNQIQVVPEAKRKEVDARDDKIKDEIQKLVDKDARLQNLSLAIDSNNGVVTLDGSVDTNEQLWTAVAAIRKIAGVKSIVTAGVTVKEDVKA